MNKRQLKDPVIPNKEGGAMVGNGSSRKLLSISTPNWQRHPFQTQNSTISMESLSMPPLPIGMRKESKRT
jgi:hypothetical protein